MTTTDEPRVWVGCLACYNAGRLVGGWYGLDQVADEPWREGHNPTHEEWQVFDTDGLHVNIGETSDWAGLETLGGVLERFTDPDQAVAYELWLDLTWSNWRDDNETSFWDAYCGEWESGEDYAQELASDTGAIDVASQWPYTCIDWAKAWRELELGDNYTIDNPKGGVFVFRAV